MANPTPGQNPIPKKTKPATTPKSITDAHGALLAILVEAMGIVVVVTVAGISDSVANLLLLFSVGLWLLFLVMNADTVASFGNILTNIEQGSASPKTKTTLI